jgi:hypothetical protein
MHHCSPRAFVTWFFERNIVNVTFWNSVTAGSISHFYVELTDMYQVEDCSDFVIHNVLPQLDLQAHGVSLAGAQVALNTFLDGLAGSLEVC